MSDDPLIEDFATDEDLPPVLEAILKVGGARLDKALSDLFPTLSRARVQALLVEGVVTRDGQPVSSASSKALPGLYAVAMPAVISAIPQPENIPLTVLFEDADLIVIDKPAGMAVHPAPGSETGTLVNALLHHCAASLSGIGGSPVPASSTGSTNTPQASWSQPSRTPPTPVSRPCSPPTTSSGRTSPWSAARQIPKRAVSSRTSAARPATAKRWRC